MKIKDIITEAVKQRLDPKCWKGKHKEGTKIKGGIRVNNCVPNEGVAEDREYIPSGKERITRNCIDLVVGIDGATVDIRAMTGDSQMAYVVFDRDGDTLVADDLAVEEQYKGQGIAKIMYDYVKELGFRVKRSSDQLVAGKKFWDKNKGAENNIWEQGVVEDRPIPKAESGKAIALSNLGKFHAGVDTLGKWVPERLTHQFALDPDKWEHTFYSLTLKEPKKIRYYRPKNVDILPGTLVGDMAIANQFYRTKDPMEQEKYALEYLASLKPYPVNLDDYEFPELLIPRKEQGVAEGSSNNIPTIGINVRSDGNIDYASLIVDGEKKYESRKTDSLRPYVGKTVGIVRTGNGPAVAIGQVTIGEPIVVDVEKFNKLRNQHLVPQGSKFDIDSDSTKYLYPMINPVRWDNEKLIKSKGIVSRKIEEQGVTEGYSVSDFKMNCFESMGNFIKWIRSPKLDKRGVTRTLGDQYANLIHTHKGVLESTSKLESKAQDAKILSAKLKQLDQRDNVVIKVGKKISILSVSIIPADKFSKIEVSGFVKPKEIVKINVDNNNKIDTIEFSDGSIFPEAAEFTTVDGVNLTNTIFFPNETSVSKAYTSLWMWLNSLEGNGWTIEKYMSEDQTMTQSIEEASGYIPSNAEKNDPRFKSALTVDVKPNAIKKNAKAFSWLTTRAGIPPTARPDGKV